MKLDLKKLLESGTFRRWMVPPSALFLLFVVFFIWVFWWPNWFSSPSTRTITVSRGASFNTVVDSLAAEGIVGSRLGLRLAGRILGWTKEMMVGRYVFESGVSNFGILRDLRDGASRKLIPVAIPEGLRVRTIARRLSAELGVDSAKIAELCSNRETAEAFGLPGETLEGYLLPDTYFFHWQTNEEQIVESLVAAFKNFYHDSLRARQEEWGFSMHEVVTFASIVEGEAQLDDERAMIAGVYHNRLKRRMRLEADPTIQYVLQDGPRRLLFSDLKIKSPYNTYLHYGLPPGPINNPGRKAILAALYPVDHRYLFFVANGQGGHTFSTNYAEHQRAIRLYRRVRREMQRAGQGG